MQQQAKVQIHEQITAIPNAWYYPTHLVRGREKTMMIDAGMNLLGPCYLASLKNLLGNPELLNYLFITHSHYDHIGSASYLKRHIPGMKIGAHKSVGGLMQKQSVLEMMNRLSDAYVELLKDNTTGEDLSLQPFEIDFCLKQGDEFDLGGLTCRVYETPGHTKDTLAFYFPEIKALFPSEACGLLYGEPGSMMMQVEFLASYQDYIDSLKLMISLEPEIVCFAHGWVLTREHATDFLKRSLAETFKYRKLIESYLNAAGGDVEKTIQDMAHAEYDVKGGIFWPRVVYITNLSTQIKHIAGLNGNE